MAVEDHIRRWSSMGDDVPGWIDRQRAEVRGPSRAICLLGDDRALGKMALRLPGHASAATSSEETDRGGVPRRLVVFVVPVRRS